MAFTHCGKDYHRTYAYTKGRTRNMGPAGVVELDDEGYPVAGRDKRLPKYSKEPGRACGADTDGVERTGPGTDPRLAGGMPAVDAVDGVSYTGSPNGWPTRTEKPFWHGPVGPDRDRR